MSFLIDTSVLIEIENNNKEIIKQIELLKRDNVDLHISIFTFCEYYFGIINKNKVNKEKIVERLNDYKLINTTKTTGITFCEVLSYLKKKGKLIPHFDIFIAAIGIEYNLTLITIDNHFKEIPQLKQIILKNGSFTN